MLVLSSFNPLLPKPQDYKTATNAQLVEAYSHACLQILSQPEFKNLDLSLFLQKMKAPAVDVKPVSGSLHGERLDRINPVLLIAFYQKVCRSKPDPTALDNYSPDIAKAETLYDDIVKSLPPVGNLHTLKLPQAVDILSTDNQRVGDLYEPQGRRHSISLSDMPPALPKTLVAVEDRRFYQHNGIDQIGILRAFFKGAAGGHLEGASTITQQLARDLFLNDQISYRRKLSEMLLAGEIEHQLTKDQILNLYLNTVYFGRGSWGIEKAAETYFGKQAAALSPIEIAYLVGIVKGPNLYQYPDSRTQDRVQFVLDRMYSERIIPQPIQVNVREDLKFLSYGVARNANHAAYFRDFITQALGAAGVKAALQSGNPIKTTLVDSIQSMAESALQTGLENYEKQAGQTDWRGPLVNISQALVRAYAVYEKSQQLAKIEEKKSSESLWGASVSAAPASSAAPNTQPQAPVAPDVATEFWLRPLRQTIADYPAALPTWQVGVVLNQPMLHVGLADGSIVALDRASREWAKPLRYGDIVYISPIDKSTDWQIVQPPEVNGAVIVMDATSGKILAMVGGYSHVLSSWNRTIADRQPGSLVKPFTYMAALQAGYQPNFLLSDGPFIFPAVARGGHRWMPHNDTSTNEGQKTMRWAFEQSRNTMTADLMSDIGLNPIRTLSVVFGVYSHPQFNYPFILGDQDTNLLSLCRAYAGIDTGYLSPIEFLETPPGDTPSRAGEIITRQPVQGLDAITLFQMRYLMQGVVERGTAAASMHDLAPYVAGKTGTTEHSNDAWFIGFTPSLVVGVHVGYDRPRPLGHNAFGGTIAGPIAHQIFTQIFQSYEKPVPFPPAPAGVMFLPTNELTGQLQSQPGPDVVNEAYRSSRVEQTSL